MSNRWLACIALVVSLLCAREAHASLSASPASLAFPDTKVTGGANQLNVAVTSTTATTVTSAAFSGDTADFSFVGTPGTGFATAGSSITYAIKFDPTVAGSRAALLTITTASAQTLNIALTGTGLEAKIAITDVSVNAPDSAAATPASTAGTSTITNTANGALTLSGATVTGNTAGWFKLDACSGTGATITCPAAATGTVNPNGGTATVGFTCTPPPLATGTQNVTLTISSNADAAGSDNVATLTCTAQPPILTASSTLAFGSVPYGGSGTATFTVQNTGPATLDYTTVFIAHASELAATSGCLVNCTVAPNTTKTTTVRFTPLAATGTGALTGVALSFTTSDPAKPMFDMPVTASVDGALISAAPTSLTFPDVSVNTQSIPGSVVVTNRGNRDLGITTATVTSTDFVITAGPQTATLMPNDTQEYQVACRPTSRGTKSASLVITSTAANTPSLVVGLTCVATAGELSLASGSSQLTANLDFGDVPAMTQRILPVPVFNIGNAPVTMLTATIAGGTGYSVLPPSPTTLAGGASEVLSVKFAPQAGGEGGPATLTVTGYWGAMIPTTLTVTLAGRGLTASFTVSPPTVDFGPSRFDAGPSAPVLVCVKNTGTAPITITNIASMVSSGATNELALSNFRTSYNCGSSGNPAGDVRSGSATLAPLSMSMPMALDSLVFDVTWANHDRVGPLVGTILVPQSAPTVATASILVTGSSTTGQLAIPEMTYDFGAVDVQGGKVTHSFTLSNTGSAPLLVAFAADSTPAFIPHVEAMKTIEVGASYMFDVDYDPVLATTGESFAVNFTLSGTFGVPAGSILLTGRGIDRQIMLGDAPAFPPTFTNPGSTAPVGTVTIRNLMEAPLHVTMIVSSDASFTLADPAQGSLTVPGGGAVDVAIRFAPPDAGPHHATLTITNDDDMMSEATVDIDGIALDRKVGFAPSIDGIDVGTVGTRFATVMKDAIVLQNFDDQPHTIAKLAIVGGGSAFEIVGSPVGTVIPPHGEVRFAVRFAPLAPSSYDGQARLYLDENPTEQAHEKVKGNALFIDARGGGGCSVGGGGGGGGGGAGGAGGALAWLAALGLVVRRRRRRASTVAAMLAVTGIGGAAGVAGADNLALSTFTPTPETVQGGFQLQSGQVGEAGAWVASAVMSYATDPLVQDSYGSDGVRSQSVVSRSTLLDVGGAVALFHRWELGANMPLYSQDGELGVSTDQMYAVTPAHASARGDLTLHAKVRLLARALEGGGLAAIGGGLQLTLPTATEGQFTGVKYPTGRVLGLATLVPGAFSHRLSLTANAGAVLQATSAYANLEQKSGLLWGLGASVRAFDRVWIAGEMYGSFVPSGRAEAMGSVVSLTPIEWLAGVHLRPDHRFTIGLAAGRGLTSSVGTPALRAVLSLAVTPRADELKPIHPPPPPKPDLDEDGDGLRDSVDRCDSAAEDKDGFEDGDGCPDPDNDGDGVVDAADKCPDQPEDLDKFEDLDGCPELDNDADGVPDVADRCPLVAEDKDGFLDADGCPELDNDGDGIADQNDACPQKPETVNGTKDDDGCPDKGQGLVSVSADRLEVLEQIQFAAGTAKLSPRSTNVLQQAAATLRGHAEVLKLRVTCHVNPSANPARDQALSEERAAAVRDWLVQWGIAPSRVDTRGFGGTKPLAKAGSRNAAAINDRVELIILDRN